MQKVFGISFLLLFFQSVSAQTGDKSGVERRGEELVNEHNQINGYGVDVYENTTAPEIKVNKSLEANILQERMRIRKVAGLDASKILPNEFPAFKKTGDEKKDIKKYNADKNSWIEDNPVEYKSLVDSD